MKQFWGKYRYLLGLAGSIIVLDQLTKTLVRVNLSLEETWTPWAWMEPFARIVHWKNTGGSFGILSENSNLILILGFLVVAAILYYFPKVPIQDWSMRLVLGLLMGGVCGNLVDRLVFGYVTDFLSIFSYNVFNLADVSNYAGVLVLLVGIVVEEWQKHKNKVADLQ